MSWKEAKVTFKQRKCDRCGKIYTPRTTIQRFCSEKCRELYWQAEHAQKRKESIQPYKCEYCGKEFVPRARNQVYCSRQCGRAASRRLYTEPPKKEEKVVNKTENMREIARIARSAREKGLSYGRYTARYGAI